MKARLNHTDLGSLVFFFRPFCILDIVEPLFNNITKQGIGRLLEGMAYEVFYNSFLHVRKSSQEPSDRYLLLGLSKSKGPATSNIFKSDCVLTVIE